VDDDVADVMAVVDIDDVLVDDVVGFVNFDAVDANFGVVNAADVDDMKFDFDPTRKSSVDLIALDMR